MLDCRAEGPWFESHSTIAFFYFYFFKDFFILLLFLFLSLMIKEENDGQNGQFIFSLGLIMSIWRRRRQIDIIQPNEKIN